MTYRVHTYDDSEPKEFSSSRKTAAYLLSLFRRSTGDRYAEIATPRGAVLEVKELPQGVIELVHILHELPENLWTKEEQVALWRFNTGQQSEDPSSLKSAQTKLKTREDAEARDLQSIAKAFKSFGTQVDIHG